MGQWDLKCDHFRGLPLLRAAMTYVSQSSPLLCRKTKPNGTKFGFRVKPEAKKYGNGAIIKCRILDDWMPSILIAYFFDVMGWPILQTTMQEQANTIKEHYRISKDDRLFDFMSIIEMMVFFRADVGKVSHCCPCELIKWLSPELLLSKFDLKSMYTPSAMMFMAVQLHRFSPPIFQ